MQFNINDWARFGPLTLGAVLVTACSGSSGTSEPPPPPVNVAPTVQAGDDLSSDEQVDVMLGATASDSDGTISSYAWVQTAGTGVTLTGADTANLEFTAPVAKTEETLTFEVTVTDNDGATAADTVSVTINPVNEIDFQIQGVVWDGVAVPSDVTVNYGGDPVTVTSDAGGQYTIDIAADEDAAASLVFLRSDGTSDPEIAFHNIPMTLQAMMDASGGDGVLDAADLLGVNLTPLSTAFYGAMVRENDAVASETDVTEALARVNGGQTVSVGTAVKLISENNSGVQDNSSLFSNMHLGLPDGYADTLEFVIDPLGIQQYITAARASDPASFDGSEDAMLADDNIVEDVTDPFATFPTTITMAAENVVVARLTVNADGSGVFTEGGNETDVDWAQDSAGVITVTGVGGVAIRETESFPFRQINGTFMQVRQINSLDQVTMTPVLDLPTGKLYTHQNVITLSYPDNSADLPNEDGSNSFEVTYIEDSDYQDVDIDAMFNGASQIDILTSYFSDSFNPNLGVDTNTGFGPLQTHYNADFLTLERTGTATNGTVTTEYGSDFFSGGTWEAVDAKTLRVTFSSDRFNPGETFEIDYSLIHDNLSTVAVRREGNLEGLHNGSFAVRDASQVPASDIDAEGYYAIPVGFNSGQVFWTELQSGGVAEIVSVFDGDQDGVLEQNEVNVRPAFWTLDTNGDVQVNEYRFPVTRAPGCDPNLDACVDSRQSRWTIANRNGTKAYTLNELSIFFPDSDDNTQGNVVFFQTTARAYDYTVTAPIDVSALPPG